MAPESREQFKASQEFLFRDEGLSGFCNVLVGELRRLTVENCTQKAEIKKSCTAMKGAMRNHKVRLMYKIDTPKATSLKRE
jgi:predicted translin family RNA/ssDNA-binding protein